LIGSSKDGTVNIAREYGQESISWIARGLRLRTSGWRWQRGNTFCVDSDMELTKRVVEMCVLKKDLALKVG